jgi:transposase
MLIIGCDYHPGVQQIAFMDTETGEFGERRLEHGEGEAEKFYRDLQQAGISVRVGMEATGHARWFERLLEELHFELWIGDPLEIRATRVRKQKTDRHDAQLLLKLLLEDRFPRIWVASWENRDLRQLLWHRHRLVQMRTRIMNQLQAVALNEGVRQKKRLWGQAGRSVTSDVRPGTRAFPSFSDAVAEIADARVFGGIHFRTACVRGNVLGRAVADYVSTHAMRELDGERDGDH